MKSLMNTPPKEKRKIKIIENDVSFITGDTITNTRKSVKNKTVKKNMKNILDKNKTYLFKDNLVFLSPLKQELTDEEKRFYIMLCETDDERKTYLHDVLMKENITIQTQEIHLQKKELREIKLDIEKKQRIVIDKIIEIDGFPQELLEMVEKVYLFKHTLGKSNTVSKKDYIHCVNHIKKSKYNFILLSLFEIEYKETTILLTENFKYYFIDIQDKIDEIKEKRKEYEEKERALYLEWGQSRQELYQFGEHIFQNKINNLEPKEKFPGVKWSDLYKNQKRTVIHQQVRKHVYKEFWENLIQEKGKRYARRFDLDQDKIENLDQIAIDYTDIVIDVEDRIKLKDIKWNKKEGLCGISLKTIKQWKKLKISISTTELDF